MFKPEVEDVGINIGFGQPHAQHLPTHNKTPVRSAPMTLTRPLAFQSCCPGQPCPRGAYPSVRGMSWAKPLSSISTMGRASRSRAHRHQSFPETPFSRNPCRASKSAFGCVRAFLYVTPGLPSACHMAFGVTSNRAARSYWQAAGWSITSCASFSGSIFRTFRRSRGLGAIRLTQRLIEAMPTENRSAVSPKLRHSFYRTERTCRPKGTGYVITNSIT